MASSPSVAGNSAACVPTMTAVWIGARPGGSIRAGTPNSAKSGASGGRRSIVRLRHQLLVNLMTARGFRHRLSGLLCE
jgi:hypothetical protein